MAEMDHDLEHGMMTVGQRLRRARETKGMTLEDVATQTRVPIRHLRSIEDGKWEELPAVPYTVGFGRAYAGAVDLDAAAVGRELREQMGVSIRPTTPTDYLAPPDPARVPSRGLAWIAALLAVVLVVGFLFWRSQSGDGESPPAETPAEQVQPAETAAPAAPPQPQDLTGQPVTLAFDEAVWLRVTDRGANNARLVERIFQPGDTYQVPQTAQRPVVTTSRPQVIRVTAGGQEIGRLGTREGRVSDVSLLANDLAQQIRGQAPGANAAPGNASAPAVPPVPSPAGGNGFQPLL